MRNKILNFIRRITGSKSIMNDVRLMRYELYRNNLLEHILNDNTEGITNEKYTDHDIIVSLTSYGKRIFDVAFTIESIMQQSMKANRILLWLDYSFENKKLPTYLLRQQKRGLEIRFCKDIRSYKKLVPTLCNFPDDAIITIDDDAIYDNDLLERLIIPYLTDSRYIYCHRFHKIKFDGKGDVLPYNQWDWCCSDEEPSHLNFATGVGGVLYPPHSLDGEVKNESVFLDICKYADDVWFKAMAIKKGTLVKKVYSRSKLSDEYVINPGVQDIGLSKINVGGEAFNDLQIKAVFSKYNLYDKLK